MEKVRTVNPRTYAQQVASALRCEKHPEREGMHFCFKCNETICEECRDAHIKKLELVEKINEAAMDLMKILLSNKEVEENAQRSFIEKEGKKLRGFIKEMDKEVMAAFQELCGRTLKNNGKITSAMEKKMNELKDKSKYNELIILCARLKKERENIKKEDEVLDEEKLVKLNEKIAASVNKFNNKWLKISEEIIKAKKNKYKGKEENKVIEHKGNEIEKLLINEEKKIKLENEEFENVLYSFYTTSSKFLLYDIETKNSKVTLFEQYKDTLWSGSCKIRNKIYFAGGYNSKMHKPMSDCVEYEILQDLSLVRNELCTLYKPVYANTLVNLDNHLIFSIGGYEGKQYARGCEKYEISKNKWISSKSLNGSKCLVTAIVLYNRYIYSIGGYKNEEIKNGIEKLDAQTENKWEIIRFNNFPYDLINGG